MVLMRLLNMQVSVLTKEVTAAEPQRHWGSLLHAVKRPVVSVRLLAHCEKVRNIPLGRKGRTAVATGLAGISRICRAVIATLLKDTVNWARAAIYER